MNEISTYEHTIKFDQSDIYVKEWRSTNLNTAPLILLHDSLGCVSLWRDFPELLAQSLNRTVIAYDRSGFGKSSARTELPSIHFVEEEATIYLPKILSALNISKFHLFGHSVGGGMSLIAAGKMSGCLSVISESAQAFVEERTRQGIEAAKVGFAEPGQLDRLKKYHGEKASWVLHAWTDVWLSDGFKNWSLDSFLPYVKCPSLIIHGDKDEYGSVAFPERIAGLVGGVCSLNVLSDCGHVPHKEKTDTVLKAVSEFYNKNGL